MLRVSLKTVCLILFPIYGQSLLGGENAVRPHLGLALLFHVVRGSTFKI